VVIDGDAQELGPDAPDGVATMAGDAIRSLLELDQALYVEVQQVSPGALCS
jgi:hypothetical protein